MLVDAAAKLHAASEQQSGINVDAGAQVALAEDAGVCLVVQRQPREAAEHGGPDRRVRVIERVDADVSLGDWRSANERRERKAREDETAHCVTP